MMKIGLISRGRTRSSVVLNALSKKHRVVNCQEIYLNAQKGINKIENSKNFEKQILDITNNIFLKQNFICKLWPSMLIKNPHMFKSDQNFDDIKTKVIFNISEYFRIAEYDKLYYLNRNLHHSTSSWVYRYKRIQIMRHARHINTINEPLVITIDDIDLSIVRFYILEYCLQEKIKDFLCKQKIPYTDISETYTQYIDNKPNNNDYTKLITNYDILPSFIDDWYKVCCENTIDWQYY